MRWYQRFFRRGLTEKHLDTELRFHLDQQIADYIATGMKLEEARRRAQLEFGSVDRVKEECRDVGKGRHVEVAIQNFRYALRRLVKNPGFTTVAILSLALGIGANTAIFALIDAVMIRTLPIEHPEQLVLLGCRYHHRPNPEHSGYGGGGGEPTFSYQLFQQFKKRNGALVTTFAFVPMGFTNTS